MLYPGPFKNSMVDYESINEFIHDYDRVLALGNFPSSVLTKLGVKHFKLPHPSPLNRMINSPDKIKEILDECRNYIYG